MEDESIQIQDNESKKLRMTDTDNSAEDNDCEDIISHLPENIISRILSILPTKDVLRTCVLSRDWEYKWTSIYNIDINDEGEGEGEGEGEREGEPNLLAKHKSFDDFVKRIFMLSRVLPLKRFRLFCQQQHDESSMMIWITGALLREVEDLEIVYDFEGFVLPRSLLNCKSLTKLKLKSPCTFRPSENMLSNLKVLHLAMVHFFSENWRHSNLLKFTFPVLEAFELRYCKWVKVKFVEINAPALTELKVTQSRSDFGADDCRIKISGAKLQKIGFHEYFREIFDLSESTVFSAVVDSRSYLDIEKNRRAGLHARLLLSGCSRLNHLQLSGRTLEDIFQSKEGPPLPSFNMLKRLEISTECRAEAFLEFLHSTPSLEWIKLNVYDWHDYHNDLVKPVPSCLVSHLSEIEFCGFNGEQTHVHFADFLLKNAVELKKMSGLVRARCEEGADEHKFWASLKKVFRDGNIELDSSVQNMADFELLFG